MKRIIFASLKKNVGKTSLILGLSRTLNKKCSYLKPFGDRMRYHKKKLWDYDAELVNSVLELNQEAHKLTLGFEHEKLRYMYNDNSLPEKLNNMCQEIENENENDILFLEGPNDPTYGASIGMNSLRIAKHTKSQLIIILNGSSNTILDELTFIKHNVIESGVNFKGVIINKIHNMDEFQSNEIINNIKQLGITIFGHIPYNEQLTTLSLKQICDAVMATPISAPEKLDNHIENIYIGSMSLNEVLKKEYLQKNNKLLITSGDRSDIIITALKTNAKGIIITNNILPPANIISMASDHNVPMLLTTKDTFSVAQDVDKLEALLNKNEINKFKILDKMIKENININELL